jgi:hypothetical protein
VRIPHASQRVTLRLGTTDVAAFEHVVIEHAYKLPPIRPSLVIDAGANIGLASVYPNVVPVNAALWNATGTIRIIDAGDVIGGCVSMPTAVEPKYVA